MRYIGEPIDAIFDRAPVLEKKPGCPNGFVWNEKTYRIDLMLSQWHDYRRRGRMARNMRPEHLELAAQRGSWGVGRDYYRVRVETGRVFELYYDRKPKSVKDRKGAWYLYREILTDPETDPEKD